jgi:hypothetical protein
MATMAAGKAMRAAGRVNMVAGTVIIAAGVKQVKKGGATMQSTTEACCLTLALL